jgi:hypothetical protein
MQLLLVIQLFLRSKEELEHRVITQIKLVFKVIPAIQAIVAMGILNLSALPALTSLELKDPDVI